jgi:O-antigen/teichoic acid export membrane protein
MSLRHLVRRLGWGVTDQAVSSLSNVLVSLVVAHALPPSSFGAFSLAFVTYALVLNASRGLSTDPLLVRFSGAADAGWRQAVAGATATATAVGIGCGLMGVALGLLLPGQLGAAFLALGAGLPLLMLEDSWRFAFFAVGRGLHALVLDLVWTVLAIGGLAALVLTHTEGVTSCLLVFGGSSAVSAGLGVVLSGVRPRPGLIGPWVRGHQRLGGRYLIENLAVGGSRQLRTTAVGAVAGLGAVGVVRAAEILMGPFLVVLMGIAQVAVPEASRVMTDAPGRLRHFCLLIGGSQAVVALAWGLGMLVVLPYGVGQLLLGDLWHAVHPLILPITLGVVLGCLSSGATSGLRALGASPRSLRAQLTASGLYVVGGTVGALLGGAEGSAWGWTAGTLIGVAVWWHELGRACAEHVPAADPHPVLEVA